MTGQLLLLDIGGSRTRAAIYAVNTNEFSKVHYEKVMTMHIKDIAQFISEFLRINSEMKEEDTSLIIAAAGPLRKGIIELHNSTLSIDRRKIERQFNFKNILLVNDVIAAAARINAQYSRIDKKKLFMDGDMKLNGARFIMLGEEDYEPECDDNSALTVIKSGTGLGIASARKANAAPEKTLYTASEAARLPAQSFDSEDADMIRYIFEKYDRLAALEDMSSGKGIEDYYELLTSKNKSAKQMCVDYDEDLSSAQSLRFFLKNQGRIAAAAANIFVPYNGIIITGNIISSAKELIKDSGLRREFLTYASLPHSDSIPLILYIEHDVNIKGCIEIAAQKLNISNPTIKD